MKKIQLLFFLCLVSLSAQEQKGNVITLEKYADSLYYDLSNHYSDKNYVKALDLRNAILLKYTDTTTAKYKTSLAKKYASKAIYLRYKQQFDSAIVNSKKALSIIETIKKQDLFLKGYVYMHLYEQLVYNGDWNTSYKLTKKTLQIFKDTLPDNHKVIADVEFDIGYIAGHFGEDFTSIKQYKISRDKYISFMGENNHEVALKHYHLATVYGFVGFYKKELESYKKAIEVWGTTDYEDKSYLSIAYGSMSTWYLQHGEYEKAEQYLIKKEKLAQNSKGKKWFNETYKGRTQVELWLGYSEVFWHKKDTVNALLYTNKALGYLNNFDVNDKRNNPNNVPYMERFLRGSLILTLRKKRI